MRGTVWVILVAAILSAPAGAGPFILEDTPARFRAAVLDEAGGRLFVAAYDRGELWVYDPASRARLRRIPVGRGPAALAIADNGRILACVNRLDATLSLMRLPEAEVYATLPLGKGAATVAPVPGGRFVVACAFDDSLCFIDPSGAGDVVTMRNAPPVPSGAAAGEHHFAVIARAAPSVQVFPSGSTEAAGRLALDAPPIAVGALPGGRFAVATASAVYVVDAAAKVLARNALSVSDVAVAGGRLYVLSNGRLLVMDTGLRPVDEIALEGPAQRLSVGGGVIAALDPAGRTWQTLNPGGVSLRQPMAGTDPVVPETAAPENGALMVEEAEPVDLVTPEPPPEPDEAPLVMDAGPVSKVEAPVPAEEAVSAVPSPEPIDAVTGARIEASAPAEEDVEAIVPAESPEPVEAEPVPEAEEVAVAETAPEVDVPPESPPPAAAISHTVHQYPLRTGTVRAPRPGRRPSVVATEPLTQRTITDAVTRPTEFGAPGSGFEAPDLTKGLRGVRAGQSVVTADRVVHTGDVRLRIGDMYFNADEFTHARAIGDFHAKGQVRLRQGTSEITTDEIFYWVPDEDELPEPSVLEAFPTEEERARKRLTLGRVDAQKLHILEPTREMTADHLLYDFGNYTGTMTNVRGRAGIYYYGAEELRVLGKGDLEGDDVWVTTCDHDPPHYRLRLSQVKVEDDVPVMGESTRLQFGNVDTPLYLPKWRRGGGGGSYPWTFDADTGRRAEIGYYLNVGQRFEITPHFAIGPRVFATEKEGVGFGADMDYDFRNRPASYLYRTHGQASGLYTTEDRGYIHWYNRFDASDDLVFRAQVEHWGDRDFYKDFFYDEYRDRTSPRAFANVTYRRPGYLATGTLRVSTESWTRETERLPEATFHLFERRIADRLYFTFDTVNGYNDRNPSGAQAARTANVARLTYDWDPWPALSITPFLEGQVNLYSEDRNEEDASALLSGLGGVTAQTRFHRVYKGRWGFDSFKHVIVPSITYSYRPKATMDFDDVPRFDALDSMVGRSRIESTIDNVFYGRDAETGEVWQVGRLSLYQGNDLWNESIKTEDYEIEIDIRPRPWWGFQFVGERHLAQGDYDLDEPQYWERTFYELYESITGSPFDSDRAYEYNATYGDYNRMLTQLYYNKTAQGGPITGRVGFAYTETQNRVFNREVIYGLGWKLGDHWGLSFEHVYDLEEDDLRSQTYEVRRSLHCWETALRFRDRESGFDIDVAFYIKAFPGSRLKF